MSDYDDELEAQQQRDLADGAPQSCSVMGAGPVSPPASQIPVDPFGIERPGDWAYPESEPPGFTPGNPLPGRPNVDPSPPQSTPDAPQVDPAEPIPDTLRSPDVQPPGTETPSPEIPVQDAPTSTPDAPAPESPIEPGPDTLRSPGTEGAGEGAGEAAVEGGEGAGETLLEGGETIAEGGELAESGAALGELAPVAAAGIAGYAFGSAIAPYVYGDKNLDGSPVIKYENADDVDTDYKNSYAYKINQWLDD